MKNKTAFLGLLLLTASIVSAAPAPLKLATTTSTDNSGLLGVLLPAFTKKTGISVHVIAVGSGKAIKLGENGDVDVLLVHSRKAEERFVAAGFGVDRRDVMYNDFVVVGPTPDPAGIKGETSAAAACKKIAAARAVFISRGDESGTHVKERELWQSAGITPSGAWYLQAGQGMEAVLMMADEKQGYTLADRGTFIAIRDKLRLVVLCEGDTTLFNQYGIMAVNPMKYTHTEYPSAKKLIDWITSVEGQAMIAGFMKNGGQLFFPNFEKKEKSADE